MPAVFAHGALRLYLLALLEDGPKHGYELMKALEERFGGTYTPSAGTIYPRLTKLEADGLVVTEAQGRRTTYSITRAGLTELADRQADLADIEHDISASVRRLADDLREELRSNMRGLRADLAASAEAARQSAGRTRPANPNADSRRGARELEAAVDRFRDETRAGIRRYTAESQDGIPDAVAEAVHAALQRAQEAIVSALSRER